MNKKNIVVFSGAGLSKDSGLATFRDSEHGLWANYKVEDVATHSAWVKNPSTVLDFYKQRFEEIKSVKPNEAHESLAKLQEKYTVFNYTQNIDDLLERSNNSIVRHLHGSCLTMKCSKHKDISGSHNDPLFKCNYRDKQETPVKLGDLCPKCNAQLRPDVVFFEEAVDMDFKELGKLTKNCYAFIIIGTSGLVSPAANIINMFANIPLKFCVDLDIRSHLRLKSFGLLEGTAKEKVPELVDFLLKLS